MPWSFLASGRARRAARRDVHARVRGAVRGLNLPLLLIVGNDLAGEHDRRAAGLSCGRQALCNLFSNVPCVMLVAPVLTSACDSEVGRARRVISVPDRRSTDQRVSLAQWRWK